MPVIDVQQVLEQAVKETLCQVVGTGPEVVNYHLCAEQLLTYCEEGDHFDSDLCWRLNLLIFPSEEQRRGINLTARLPYDFCSDGDVAPVMQLVRRMWEHHRFGGLMLDGDLDKHLDALAVEIEQGP